MEIFYSDCKEDADETGNNDTSNVDFDNSLTFNLTSESAYEGDISTYATNTLLDTKRRKKLKKHKLAPISRTSYYGQKRLMIRKRHFVLSVMEYFAGASLGSSARKIPFYSLLVSPQKPTTKNKVPDPIRADVICDTGASISLAPLSIAQTLKLKIHK